MGTLHAFTHRAVLQIPQWGYNLNNYYWTVRVEKRNKAKLRKAYRMIEAEKLKLVEAGHQIEVVNALCKYLVSLKQVNADRFEAILITEFKQLRLNF